MASESALNKWLRKKLKGFGIHWQRIENIAGSGTPDINVCIHGVEHWIESKEMDAFPKRPETGVRVSLRQEQIVWLILRWRADGHGWVLVQVGREVFLFDGQYAQELKAGAWDQGRFREMATATGRIEVPGFLLGEALDEN